MLLTLALGTASVLRAGLLMLLNLLSILRAMIVVGAAAWMIWWIVDRIRSVMIGDLEPAVA